MNANLAVAHAFRAPSVHHHLVRWLIALLAALALVACGGGGGSSDPVAQPSLAITQQPADQSTATGSAATFRIAATGNAAIQWQRLGQDGQWADIAGATQAELALTGVTEADNGRQYRAQVRAGTVVLTSSVVTLKVSPPVAAAVAAQPQDVQLRVGQVPSFSVTAVGTSVSYQWQGSTDGLGWADVSGATTETLTLPAAVLADSGRLYRVVVRNSLATVTSRAVTLGVLPPLAKPLFTAQPQDRSVEAGQGATFTATSSGEPAPTLQWETSLDGQSWTPVAGATVSTLVVADAALTDNGRRYRAVATNSEGREVSGAARLTVTAVASAPSFVRQPQAAAVMQSQSAAFEAEAGGNPTPTYQWQVSLDDGKTFTNINGATGARLELPTTVDADEGKLFRVVASNRLGDVASTAARLTLLRLPQVTVQPQDVISGVTDAAVTVTVAGTGNPAPTVQWQYSSDDGANYKDVRGATEASFTLAPASAQLVRAKLSNAAGVAYSKAVRVNKARWTHVSPSFVGTRLNSVRWLDSRIAVAVGNQGAVVRTTDGGATWTFVNEPMADLPQLQQLAVLDSRTVVAAGSNGVMIRSEDAGKTWSFVPIPTRAYVNSLSFRNASVGVMNTYTEGAFRTVDGGLTWTRIPSADPAKPLEKLSSIVLRGTLGFATGMNGWFRSTDGGASWNALDLPASSFPQMLVSVTFVDDQTLAIANGPFARSTDGGLTWQAVPPISGVYAPRSALRFSRDGQVGIDVEGSMRSTDRGQTWAWRGIYTSFTDVDFSPDNVALGVGENGELRLSTDQGATWGAPYGSQGLEGADLWGVAFPSNDDRGVAVGSLGNSMVLHQTADGGRTWTPVQQFPNPGGAIRGAPPVFVDAQVGMAPSDGPLLRTVDGGRSWVKLPNPGWYTNGVAMLDRDTILLSSMAGVHRSVDGGNSWTAVLSVSSFQYELQPERISARGNVVLVPTLQGRLHRSIDGGKTWSTGTYSGTWPASIAWTSDSTVFILNVRGALSRSDDAGVTWREVRAEPQPVELYGQISFSADGRLGFMVSNSTIYRTSDGGQTWNRDLVRTLGWLKGVGFVGPNKPVVVGQDGTVLLGDGY